jgi:hypothetical protein
MVYIEKGSFIRPVPLTVYILWGLYYVVGPEVSLELLSTQGSLGGLAAVVLLYLLYWRRKYGARQITEGHSLTENDLDGGALPVSIESSESGMQPHSKLL